MTHTFTTITASGLEVEVTYTFSKGYAPTYDDPGSPDEIDIIKTVPDVPLEDHDDLAGQCAEDHDGVLSDATECKAEMRRDYE